MSVDSNGSDISLALPRFPSRLCCSIDLGVGREPCAEYLSVTAPEEWGTNGDDITTPDEDEEAEDEGAMIAGMYCEDDDAEVTLEE